MACTDDHTLHVLSGGTTDLHIGGELCGVSLLVSNTCQSPQPATELPRVSSECLPECLSLLRYGSSGRVEGVFRPHVEQLCDLQGRRTVVVGQAWSSGHGRPRESESNWRYRYAWYGSVRRVHDGTLDIVSRGSLASWSGGAKAVSSSAHSAGMASAPATARPSGPPKLTNLYYARR